jgi:integrase
VFVVVYATGIRRGELPGLRWSRVRLADPDGPTVRVDETFVGDQVDTPKSEASERTIPLGRAAAEALYARFTETAYQDDGDRVFCHPQTGGPFDRKAYADTFRAALAKAEVEGKVRPFHDGRHSSITNAAPPASRARRYTRERATPTSRRRSGTSTSPGSASRPKRSSPRRACWAQPRTKMGSTVGSTEPRS